MNLDRKWEIYLLHHSHTDIGYTDCQEEITQDHIQYIRQSIRILKKQHQNKFRWICETLWGVEQFFKCATAEEIEDFCSLAKKGKISLSGSYLNMTEAIDGKIMRRQMLRAHQHIKERGLSAQVALTSDVNGYAWGYVDILAACGVDTLISQLNSFHGKEPLQRRQTPFVWESPRGNRILVWIGDHYNIGNWVGLEPCPLNTIEEALSIAEKQLPEYLQKMVHLGYEYNFLPLGISGVFTDNGPPNDKITNLVELWNQKHGDEIHIRMASLEEFSAKLKEIEYTLPIYRGDWTDWWADGIASTPASLKLFREAQRIHLANLAMDPEEKFVPQELIERIEYYLNMYAEHTWGYHASVSEPWASAVYELEAKKTYYAVEAHICAKRVADKILSSCGKARKERTVFDIYAMNNPTKNDLLVPVTWEAVYYHPQYFAKTNYLMALDGTEQKYPVQISNAKVHAVLPILAGQQLMFQSGWSKEFDVLEPVLKIDGNHYDTGGFSIFIDMNSGGVTSIFDKRLGRELITYAASEEYEKVAFRPIYEVTKDKRENPCGIRQKMGRSRRNEQTVHIPAELVKVECVENGPVFAVICLEYSMQGATRTMVEWKLYSDISRIDVRLILNKNSVWDPESVYLSLPFADKDSDLYIDKAACVFRPGIDGLPRACKNFYSVETGVAFVSQHGCTSVALLDAPMIWLGNIRDTEAAEIDDNSDFNHAPVWSWVMNNFWETNFKAELGGSYEFRYTLNSRSELDPEKVLADIKEESICPIGYNCTKFGRIQSKS